MVSRPSRVGCYDVVCEHQTWSLCQKAAQASWKAAAVVNRAMFARAPISQLGAALGIEQRLHHGSTCRMREGSALRPGVNRKLLNETAAR